MANVDAKPDPMKAIIEEREKAIYQNASDVLEGKMTAEEFAEKLPQLYDNNNNDWGHMRQLFGANRRYYDVLTPILLEKMVGKYGVDLLMTSRNTVAYPRRTQCIDALFNDDRIIKINEKYGNVIAIIAYIKLEDTMKYTKKVYTMERDPIGPCKFSYLSSEERLKTQTPEAGQAEVVAAQDVIMTSTVLYLRLYYHVISHRAITEIPLFKYKGPGAIDVTFGTGLSEEDFDRCIDIVRKDIAAIRERRALLQVSAKLPRDVFQLISSYGIKDISTGPFIFPPTPEEKREADRLRIIERRRKMAELTTMVDDMTLY